MEKIFRVVMHGVFFIGFSLSGAEHDHEADLSQHHDDHSVDLPKVPKEKWLADDTLHASIEKIRKKVKKTKQSGDKDLLSAAELGMLIKGEVSEIVQKCKLEPAADNYLHGIIKEFLEASSVLENSKHKLIERKHAFIKIEKALESYSKGFNHK